VARENDLDSVVTFDQLRERVLSFLTTQSCGIEAQDLIGSLSHVGPVAIFGGLLRDLARNRVEAFSSDVDLVVDADPALLDHFMAAENADRNSYGGWRLQRGTHKFDVWTLSSTWAVRKGLVSARRLADLTRTTFFDCDAIVYICSTRELHCDREYLERLATGVVGLNLRANPNTIGAAARTIRILKAWRCSITEDLSRFLVGELTRHSTAQLAEAQVRTIGSVLCDGEELQELRLQLKEKLSVLPESDRCVGCW
jgi:hypothetical protein